jgi:hypothetical protein
MNYITLKTEITGFVVVNDAVCEATIVGVEIDNEDKTWLVVLVNNGIDITTRRVKEVFPDRSYAEITLKNILSDRVLLEKFDAKYAPTPPAA